MTATAPTDTPPAGIRCPQCGCRKLPTLYTRHRSGPRPATVRVRECSGCGHRVRTVERVESTSA